MNWANIFLIAIGLSMDAFAMAITVGLTVSKAGIKEFLVVGFYFGLFQAAMPVVGYFAARRFAYFISQYDHWVVFGLLIFIGGKMIWSSFNKDIKKYPNKQDECLGIGHMLPLAIATSIDALAVGVFFAVYEVRIVPAITIIGVTTFVVSILGVKIGNIFGERFKSKAGLVGGIILILIGISIIL